MFWQSVEKGLAVLLHWQTYAAIIEFLVILMLPRIFFTHAVKRYPTIRGAWFLLPLNLAIFQTLAVMVLVLTLAPMIIGRADGAVWAFPWVFAHAFPAVTAKLVLLTIAVGMFLSIFKLDLFTNAAMGCVVLAVVTVEIVGLFGLNVAHLWPGLWFTIGILIVSAVLFYSALLLTAGVSGLLGEDAAAIGQMIAFPIGAALMFLPMFIYGGWLVNQIGK